MSRQKDRKTERQKKTKRKKDKKTKRKKGKKTKGLIRLKTFGQFLNKSLKKRHFLIELDVAIWFRRLAIILILTPGLSQTKSFSSRLFKENNF